MKAACARMIIMFACGLLATACGGGGGGRPHSASSQAAIASSSTPTVSLSEPVTSSASPASTTPQAGKVPAGCGDKRLTAAMAKLAAGKKLNRKLSSKNGSRGKLTCWWEERPSFTSVTIEPPSGQDESADMQVMDVPEIAKFGAVARARTTEIAGSRGTFYIVAFVVTSDKYRILVNAGGRERQDQAAGDAAVLITELLHTS